MRQMFGQKLRVEQVEPACLQPRHQMHQGNLGGVRGPREHAFAKKRAAQRHAIQAADQPARLPALNRMGMADVMQRRIALPDGGVDPRLRPFRSTLCACCHHLGKRAVYPDLKAVLPHHLGQRARQVEPVQGNHPPPFGFHPEHILVIGILRHWENTACIGAQQQVRREHGHRNNAYPCFAIKGRGVARRGYLPASHCSSHLMV